MAALRYRRNENVRFRNEIADLIEKDEMEGLQDVQNESDEEEDEEDAEETLIEEDISPMLPQSTDNTPTYLKAALNGLPDRWRNWTVRGIFSLIMISGLALTVYGGPFTLMFAVLVIQVKCFQEIISIGYQVYRIHGLPWFRSLSWYLLLTSNYYLYGENMLGNFGVIVNRFEGLKFLVTYHRFLSFALYCIGFVWFVLSLVKKYYLKQFSLFAWTHVALLVIVVQSHLIIQNIFEGIIWFIAPVSMIVCNDCMAYVFGFFFGKTPLIKLSPKKTWEGFVGGGLATVCFGILFSHVLCHYQFFVCPVQYSDSQGSVIMECDPGGVFQKHDYNMELFGQNWSVNTFPFVWHSILLGLFSSIIGPFGGFFASGFKRAFKIKDFGDTIPGHGGIMDRFDCQYLMATFVNVYISSFIRTSSADKLLKQIFYLPGEEQQEIFKLLKEHLGGGRK